MTLIINDILDAVVSSEEEVLLDKFNFSTQKQNQLLFFFKPEVFLLEREDSKNLINMVFDTFQTYAVNVDGSLMLSGSRLDELGVMDRHYGYINIMSKKASSELSEADKEEIYKLLELNASIPILGGHEFLQKYNTFDYNNLDEMWAKKQSKRLRSGLYFQVYDIGSDKIVIVNGFHPAHLAHFTAKDRRIVLLLLHSDAPWRVLRGRMLGDTFPEKAMKGSIRRVLHDRAGDFGFDHVGIANNCAHLSAGPFEALHELNNFLSPVRTVNFDISLTRIAQFFSIVGMNEVNINHSIQNPVAMLNESETSLFEITEDTDSRSAVELYRLFFSK